MRTSILTGVFTVTSLAAVLSMSCGPDTKPANSAAPDKPADSAKPVSKPVPKPSDESFRFPKTNLIATKVVDRDLLGKAFMPGGTLAHYKKGKVEYDMFVARVTDANAAALLLPDWRTSLSDAKLVPSFGGYFGSDAGRPVFVFSKGSWIAGIAGLPLKDADVEARTLASRLN
jgi:hypothetical protein